MAVCVLTNSPPCVGHGVMMADGLAASIKAFDGGVVLVSHDFRQARFRCIFYMNIPSNGSTGYAT